MGWKDWSYWLKGGIIGAIIYSVILPLSFLLPRTDLRVKIMETIYYPVLIMHNFFPPMSFVKWDMFYQLIFYPLMGFIIGAITGYTLGYIIKKIKSRKQAQSIPAQK